jgi:predicted O-methyltransferase YrrM
MTTKLRTYDVLFYLDLQETMIMTDEIFKNFPAQFAAIDQATKDAGFTMPSEAKTGALLSMLAGTKPSGAMLELGTGTGLSAAWILEGMDDRSTLTSVDNDPTFLNIARQYLVDSRLSLIQQDAGEWIQENSKLKFDFIFADTWHGKYLMLEDVLDMLNPGGLYIIDDMLPQANWPDGHQQKALRLVEVLESRADLNMVKLAWATGIIISSKKV